MQAPLSAMRRWASALTLLHLVIFASYFVPYMSDPQENIWQVLLPPWNSLFAFSRAPLIVVICIMFVPLLFPLAASWLALRWPLKIMSLVNLRLCLPILGAAWFFWSVLALELYAPTSGLQGILRLALFVPVFGMLVSAWLCLRQERLLRTYQLEASMYPIKIASEGDPGEEEVVELADPPQQVLRRLPFFSLVSLGLLCQVVVLLSLFLPFTDIFSSYAGRVEHINGWQTFGLTFPLGLIALLLLVFPLLPIIFALLYRVPLLSKNIQREVFHRGGVYLSYWLTLVCFLLSSIVLEYSLLFIGADDAHGVHWMDVAFGIPVVAFFLALFCGGTLRVFLLRSSEVPMR